ncbi:hypothetical protein RclHR1_00130055 [Rhizophagus clarus]|uniref:Uncharacterized protein n=1 Tax=Rhizophagus clarus TaxID=94130 RepID=A0A2Z6QNS8_9GLOM|nr:hypothetical protein RclHR1_00130055 [Rhizophagus clarus]GET04598.1 hypothetical protein GLOIN_2v1781441 [Rhizophagus clarus]
MQTIFHKHLIFFLLNIFTNYKLLVCGINETLITNSSKIINATRIGISTKIDIRTDSNVSSSVNSEENDVIKPIAPHIDGTIIGIIAASMTVVIALLFICKNNVDKENNDNSNNENKV